MMLLFAYVEGEARGAGAVFCYVKRKDAGCARAGGDEGVLWAQESQTPSAIERQFVTERRLRRRYRGSARAMR